MYSLVPRVHAMGQNVPSNKSYVHGRRRVSVKGLVALFTLMDSKTHACLSFVRKLRETRPRVGLVLAKWVRTDLGCIGFVNQNELDWLLLVPDSLDEFPKSRIAIVCVVAPSLLMSHFTSISNCKEHWVLTAFVVGQAVLTNWEATLSWNRRFCCTSLKPTWQ